MDSNDFSVGIEVKVGWFIVIFYGFYSYYIEWRLEVVKRDEYLI